SAQSIPARIGLDFRDGYAESGERADVPHGTCLFQEGKGACGGQFATVASGEGVEEGKQSLRRGRAIEVEQISTRQLCSGLREFHSLRRISHGQAESDQ